MWETDLKDGGPREDRARNQMEEWIQEIAGGRFKAQGPEAVNSQGPPNHLSLLQAAEYSCAKPRGFGRTPKPRAPVRSRPPRCQGREQLNVVFVVDVILKIGIFRITV